MAKQKIAVWNTWKNAIYDNCAFISPDIWIKDEWENLKVKNSKIIINSNSSWNVSKWYEIWWNKYLIFPIIAWILLIIVWKFIY